MVVGGTGTTASGGDGPGHGPGHGRGDGRGGTPTSFGRYELRGLLGRGGMGEVHRAYDREQARTVALKLLPAGMAADEELVERFKRESYAAAQLTDPHVIPIHRYGQIDGRLYIDMRLVDGVDLADLIAGEGALPAERAVSLLGQAAQALDAAHARDLVHRDVKPSNLLVTAHDFVYLVDFGIALLGGQGIGARPLTADGSTVGTFDYMAPERLLRGREVDRRVDVYSLACVLFEMLTGRRPYAVRDVAALVHAHLYEPPPRVTAFRPDLPAGFDDVVARGMAKAPEDRHPTCGDLAAAAAAVVARLRRHPPSVPVPAPRPVPTPAPPTDVPAPPTAPWPPADPRRRARRRRLAGWLLAAGSLVAVAVLAAALLAHGAPGESTADADRGGEVSSAGPAPSAGSPPVTATRGPGTPPPRARGDLGLATPISDPACDGGWVLVVGSAVTPGTYEEEVAALLEAHPGADYLLTEGGCASLRQSLDGERIYAVYRGPFPDRSAACAARDGTSGDAYVKRLDEETPPDRLWEC
ncbi:serine/threonine protein kinase [Geodermatophilus sp. YIM 151500]|uniref:serine/threonine-protein kinase n=1 Tax=Geodermatophilus sp. YIM 151500 TaxID=2984531 RepID=UPI0021E43DBB|nr:serine/threonine-protein kinase [Geodermatophilus sp. YIM 151500]MCV2491332.1 serine/threonine protein kinase [Geodermatophilus sp. YIM 151500]